MLAHEILRKLNRVRLLMFSNLYNTFAPHIFQPATESADSESKHKVLLERLKKLEAENSSLVLENETQRQQYEKCLDEIANQVRTVLTYQGFSFICAG